MQNLIKVERARNDMSQAALAEKVHVTRQTVHTIDKGGIVLSTALAFKIASIFNIKVDELFNWQNLIGVDMF